jgi:hypothetical protein
MTTPNLSTYEWSLLRDHSPTQAARAYAVRLQVPATIAARAIEHAVLALLWATETDTNHPLYTDTERS